MRKAQTSLRDPDGIVEGQFPIWICDAEDCPEIAHVAEHRTYFGGVHTIALKCDRHRWRGGAVTANTLDIRDEHLPKELPKGSQGYGLTADTSQDTNYPRGTQ